jgi:hypothetical protein
MKKFFIFIVFSILVVGTASAERIRQNEADKLWLDAREGIGGYRLAAVWSQTQSRADVDLIVLLASPTRDIVVVITKSANLTVIQAYHRNGALDWWAQPSTLTPSLRLQSLIDTDNIPEGYGLYNSSDPLI